MVDIESVPADDGIYCLPRGASFSDGSIAEPVSPVIEKVNTEPGASNIAPPAATNGNQPAAAAQAAVPIGSQP